eukprot:gene2865-biopygen9632
MARPQRGLKSGAPGANVHATDSRQHHSRNGEKHVLGGAVWLPQPNQRNERNHPHTMSGDGGRWDKRRHLYPVRVPLLRIPPYCPCPVRICCRFFMRNNRARTVFRLGGRCGELRHGLPPTADRAPWGNRKVARAWHGHDACVAHYNLAWVARAWRGHFLFSLALELQQLAGRDGQKECAAGESVRRLYRGQGAGTFGGAHWNYHLWEAICLYPLQKLTLSVRTTYDHHMMCAHSDLLLGTTFGRLSGTLAFPLHSVKPACVLPCAIAPCRAGRRAVGCAQLIVF